jgi:hypothetical protein
MDPRSAGALGGRPTKSVVLGRSSAAAVASGTQLTLNFSGKLTLSGPVTIKATTVNIGAGASASASAGGRASDAKRARDDDASSDDDDDDDGDGDADADSEALDDDDESDVADASDLEVDEATAALLATLPLREKRRIYTTREKEAILAVYHATNSNKTATLRILHKKSGYEKVGRRHIYRWLKEGVNPKPRCGRKVNEPFERAVLGHLLFTVLEKVDDVENARIVANIAHSYEIIKRAATTTQKEAPWASDAKIQKLQFSNPWVSGFLRRSTLRRRRNTSSDKELPPVSVVAARMKEIQAVITAGPAGGQPVGQPPGYEPDDRVNADETASRYAAAPLNQYVPHGKKRGAAPEFEESARFTSMLGGTAAGNMLPAFNIIKCTVDRADLRSTTVIQTLHKQAGYTAADGWALKIWERELALKIKGVEKTVRYFRPYLVHVDGTVITTQHKAWMDSVGMCMWVDLLIGPWAKASGRKKILVWDSCGPHKVAAVKAVFDEWCVCVRTRARTRGEFRAHRTKRLCATPLHAPASDCPTAEQRILTASFPTLSYTPQGHCH